MHAYGVVTPHVLLRKLRRVSDLPSQSSPLGRSDAEVRHAGMQCIGDSESNREGEDRWPEVQPF